MNPKVSVIMPSLNVASYIRECVESVINQTLKELEILCVDAGSTDGTLEVLEEYAAKDGRIRIIRSNKKSYGYQVNLGIDAATGEYIGIVETDDYILPDMYKDLYEIAYRESADICKADFQRFWGEGDNRVIRCASCARENLYNKILNVRDNPDIMRCSTFNQIGIYSLPFLRNKNVRLNESPGASYQDNGFWFQVIIQAERVYYVNKAYYMLRRDNPNSSVNSKTKVFCMCEEYDFIRSFLHQHPELEARFASRLAVYRMYNYDFTLNRIAPAFQLEFLRRYAEDFHSIEDAGELDKTLYTEGQWKKLHDIMECPEFIYYRDYYQDGRVQAEINQQKKKTDELQAEINQQKSRADGLQYDLDCVHNSVSFRAGRAITWLPRKARGGVRCYKEHGLRYTFDRGLIHMRLKEDPEHPKKRDYAYYSTLPPRKYPKELKLWYKKVMGEDLDLRNPRTFNEKIQWMKLYDATPLKTRLADKYLVRGWVKEKIGEEYLVPLLGVWDSFDKINFDELPDRFVLKANHGCGWNIIVNDKSEFNWEEAKKKFDDWMNSNFAFRAGLELHYMNIPPRIIAEQYLENDGNDLYDYKIFCFDGHAESIMFLSERKKGLKMAFYDLNWNKLPFVYSYPQNEDITPRPEKLEQMIELAEKLAEGFPHVRVDFYVLNDGSIKFGEMTFTSASGTCKWNIPEQDMVYGDLIKLPTKSPIPRRPY